MLDKILDILLYVPRVIFSAFVDALVYLFESIPAPDFVQNVDLSGFSSISFFIDKLHIDVGLAMILSALLARFILRRIPFIG